MKKKLIVNNTNYTFLYTEDANLWVIAESTNLLSGYKIDLEIDLKLLGKDINWNEVSDFIFYLQRRTDKTNKDVITKSNIALKGLFNSIYIDSFTEQVKSNIEFKLSGINYKKTISTRLGNKYEYDLFFFPYNAKDKHMDIGTFTWNVKMRGNVLYGVNCDI